MPLIVGSHQICSTLASRLGTFSIKDASFQFSNHTRKKARFKILSQISYRLLSKVILAKDISVEKKEIFVTKYGEICHQHMKHVTKNVSSPASVTNIDVTIFRLIFGMKIFETYQSTLVNEK